MFCLTLLDAPLVAQELCIQAVAASLERSPGALAGVPGACVTHVLRLLGNDVPLELAMPVTSPFLPQQMPQCGRGCAVLRPGRVNPQLLTSESYWRRRARVRWSLSEPVSALAGPEARRRCAGSHPADHAGLCASLQEAGGSWKQLYVERNLADALEQ